MPRATTGRESLVQAWSGQLQALTTEVATDWFISAVHVTNEAS